MTGKTTAPHLHFGWDEPGPPNVFEVDGIKYETRFDPPTILTFGDIR